MAPLPQLKPQPRQGLGGPWRKHSKQQQAPEVQPQIEDEAFSMELPFELKVRLPHRLIVGLISSLISSKTMFHSHTHVTSHLRGWCLTDAVRVTLLYWVVDAKVPMSTVSRNQRPCEQALEVCLDELASDVELRTKELETALKPAIDRLATHVSKIF